MYWNKKEENDNPTTHVFTEVTAAVVFFMILFIFIQQFEFIEIFKIFKIRELQKHIQTEIENTFIENGFTDRMPIILVDQDNPLIQKVMMTSRILTFPELSASLKTKTDRQILTIVGDILKENSGVYEALKIEGHADRQNLPKNPYFPTNWELSTARATTVVRFLTDSEGPINYPPEKISAVGFSFYHPVDPDDYDANRRIEFVIRYSYSKNYMYSDRAKKIYDLAKTQNASMAGE